MLKKQGLKPELKQGLSGIITGASSGIGRALAIMLARKYKAQLILNARSAETLEETAEAVRMSGGKAINVLGDIADIKVNTHLVARCLSEFGSIELLVNNAGLAIPGPIPKLTPDDWRRVFEVNFFAALEATYTVLPHFLEQGFGKIVNVASIAGKVSFPGSVCYASSKFALTGFSEGMAAELESQGIDVITVCPGWVRSEFFAKNQVSETKNPTLIAQKNNLSGWLMRNMLSMSSEDCAQEIVKACEKGGGQEIVLTGPGVFIERLHALFPSVAYSLASKIPSER